MAVRFVLHRREVTGDGRFTVQLCVNRAKRQLKVGTNLRVAPRHWSKAKGRLLPRTPGATELNAALERLASETWIRSLGQNDDEQLRLDILELVGRSPAQYEALLMDCYEEFAAQKAVRVRASTMITYEALQGHLKEAFGEDARLGIIGSTFIDDFTTHLLAKGHQNTNINKYSQRLKGFLTWLHRRELISKVPERTPLTTAKKEVISLTMAELVKLAKMDLSSAPKSHRHTRDLFVVGALTGQRFSDLQEMSWQHIDRNSWIWTVAAKKTGVTRHVPIIGWARSFLEGRLESKRPLPRISNQRANLYLKEIAQAAGLDRNVTQLSRSGAVSEMCDQPLFEVISFHIARKTFVTLMLQATGDITSVLSITHDDLKTARKYIRSDADFQANQARAAFQSLVG
jgi:integrase